MSQASSTSTFNIGEVVDLAVSKAIAGSQEAMRSEIREDRDVWDRKQDKVLDKLETLSSEVARLREKSGGMERLGGRVESVERKNETLSRIVVELKTRVMIYGGIATVAIGALVVQFMTSKS